jgi:hypothetical protein
MFAATAIRGRTMKRTALTLLVLAACNVFAVHADSPPDFSGTWRLNHEASVNLGMMAALEITVVITQSPTEIKLSEQSSFQGQPSSREYRYDLGGKPVPNPGSMGDPSETVSKWAGDKLLTTWTSEGSVAGTKNVRNETRSLSSDGKRMSVESVRDTRPAVVMVYEKVK